MMTSPQLGHVRGIAGFISTRKSPIAKKFTEKGDQHAITLLFS